MPILKEIRKIFTRFTFTLSIKIEIVDGKILKLLNSAAINLADILRSACGNKTTMKYFLLPLLLASVASAASIGLNLHGGAYNFGYATGDAGGHSRTESGSGDSVSGSYSYVDPNGDLRTVQYTAGPQGYQASGDIGVDRKTAAAAAALAVLAPKAAPAPALVAPVAPVPHFYASYGGPFFYFSYPVAGNAQYSAQW